ncbi:MAG: hypothetical protein Q9165_004105 [Trypethelium subeluteriae]
MTIFRPCIDLHAGQVKQIVGSTLQAEQIPDTASHPTSLPTTSSSIASTNTDPSAAAKDPSSLLHALTKPAPAASSAEPALKENYVSHLPASYYAQLYRDAELRGGHVIKLGPGNDDAAREALGAWHNGLQVGGGVDEGNARRWIEAGAEKVIITSYLFPSARFSLDRLKAVLAALGGDREKLVVDVSCKRVEGKWVVAMDKWTRLTDMEVNQGKSRFSITMFATFVTIITITNLNTAHRSRGSRSALPATNAFAFGPCLDSIHILAPFCSELLIHAADKEGLQRGIDTELVACLGTWCRSVPAEYQPFAVTYAGGGRSIEDLENVKRLSGGLVDLTIGSALDIFGGKGVRFGDCVQWNCRQKVKTRPGDSG